MKYKIYFGIVTHTFVPTFSGTPCTLVRCFHYSKPPSRIEPREKREIGYEWFYA